MPNDNIEGKDTLRYLNETPMSQEEVYDFLAEAQAVKERVSGFEAYIIAAENVFGRDPDRNFAVLKRISSLSHLLMISDLPDWAKKTAPDGSVVIPECLYLAMGVAPLVENEGLIEFDRETLLKKAFQFEWQIRKRKGSY